MPARTTIIRCKCTECILVDPKGQPFQQYLFYAHLAVVRARQQDDEMRTVALSSSPEPLPLPALVPEPTSVISLPGLEDIVSRLNQLGLEELPYYDDSGPSGEPNPAFLQFQNKRERRRQTTKILERLSAVHTQISLCNEQLSDPDLSHETLQDIHARLVTFRSILEGIHRHTPSIDSAKTEIANSLNNLEVKVSNVSLLLPSTPAGPVKFDSSE